MLSKRRQKKLTAVWAALVTAFVMWYIIFGLQAFNFWASMAAAVIILAVIGIWQQGPLANYCRVNLRAVITGLDTAAILYIVFLLGSLLFRWLFGFAEGQISSVYSIKTQASPYVIALLLLFIIGPAEEIFWRGFVQSRFAARWGDWTGLIAATAAYTLVHVWSGNIMLMIAALVGGLYWGFIYKHTRNLFPVIVSHAVWDVLVFLLLPLA